MNKKIFIFLISSVTAISVNAQSAAHDATKQNQFTVQEIGQGTLTPDVYYTLLHKKYKKDARMRNKLLFRGNAGVAGFKQVDPADDLDSALIKRAEVEALNMADRMGGKADIAWMAEGPGITKKMQALVTNINRIVPAGGSTTQRKRWTEIYSMYNTAIRATQEAYMPNSQRKKQYLKIYADITRSNEILVQYLVRLSMSRSTSEILYGSSGHGAANKTSIVAESFTRWRDASWSTICISGSGNHSVPTFGNTQYPWLDVDPSQWDDWIKAHPEYRKEYLKYINDNKLKDKPNTQFKH